MKIKLDFDKDVLQDLMDAFEKIDEDISEQSCYLDDGVFFSEEKPIMSGKVEFDTEKDFIAVPYGCETFFIWKGKKPEDVEFDTNAYMPGLALTFKAEKVGYYTTCFEDD